MTQSARMVSRIKSELPEFHTRTMKRSFKEKFGHISKVTQGALESVYKELSLDKSARTMPEIHERVRLILLGETGLLTDMRVTNTRPGGKYDKFFEVLEGIIEAVTAADDRRHNVAHLAEWLSLEDMMKQAQEKCEAGTPIPSKSLVRLQFTPRNPYTHTALQFTSRLKVQYKIQRRQIRASHPDAHYCNAVLKYLKEFAVSRKNDVCLLFCDDKAKIPYGEPGHIISTGVPGKQSIAPVGT